MVKLSRLHDIDLIQSLESSTLITRQNLVSVTEYFLFLSRGTLQSILAKEKAEKPETFAL